MNFRVSVAHEAEKILDRLDRPTEQRVRARFGQLAVDPFDPRLSSLLTERPRIRKSRVGGWRILFTVDREAKVIHILTVDTRGQVYKHL
ncbi:MAG: type II toxin-antitoxin system RelE/ParE family toxin [Acidobacteria bacterium]|nr:type II toxin-antitoxin system RelE/ParE family toxin [Acidobacteriota bacterium]